MRAAWFHATTVPLLKQAVWPARLSFFPLAFPSHLAPQDSAFPSRLTPQDSPFRSRSFPRVAWAIR